MAQVTLYAHDTSQKQKIILWPAKGEVASPDPT